MKTPCVTSIRRRFFLLLAAILLEALLVPGQAGAQVSAEAERTLKEAKIRVLKPRDPVQFSLPLLPGGNAALSAYKGKVVVLNFWATWCPPCRAEMPSMETFYRRFKSQGLEILAVDGGEDAATVRQFIQQNGYTFPVLLDRDNAVNSRYGVSAIPTTYILDRNGSIIATVVGSIRWDDPKVTAAFDALLKSR
jgi:peroxiredoxin